MYNAKCKDSISGGDILDNIDQRAAANDYRNHDQGVQHLAACQLQLKWHAGVRWQVPTVTVAFVVLPI